MLGWHVCEIYDVKQVSVSCNSKAILQVSLKYENESSIHEVVKSKKETNASVASTLRTAKVMSIVCTKCLSKMEKKHTVFDCNT